LFQGVAHDMNDSSGKRLGAHRFQRAGFSLMVGWRKSRTLEAMRTQALSIVSAHLQSKT
jgi:hypothetical protein